ncbi:extracellular solute-binding protein [Streptomyces capparidis]
MFKARRRVAIAAVAAGMLVLAGCGGDSGDGDGKTLRLWHYEGPESAMGKAWAEVIKEFEKTHPGVKVKFEEKSFEQIQKTAGQVLKTSQAPDLMEYNKGNATSGLLAKQGLLTDLSAEANKRGWSQMLDKSVGATGQYDENGVMGSGKWYGVPNYAEYTMVYYNKKLFEEHDVKVPTTMAEFTAALDKFADAGVTPLSNAGAEYMAQQYVYQLALTKADRAWVDAFERYTAKADFNDAAWTYGAETFADWVKKGYISKKTVGTKAEDAGVAFIQGKYPMLFSGSWWYGRFQAEMKDDWGTFLWPETKLTLGSGGNNWVVPKNAKNKELAYDFIDLTMKQAAQNTLAQNGGVPVKADPSAVTDPKAKELIKNYEDLSGRDAFAYYPDWPVPGFYDVLVQETQKLMNGTDPGKALDSLQKAYDDGVPVK